MAAPRLTLWRKTKGNPAEPGGTRIWFQHKINSRKQLRAWLQIDPEKGEMVDGYFQPGWKFMICDRRDYELSGYLDGQLPIVPESTQNVLYNDIYEDLKNYIYKVSGQYLDDIKTFKELEEIARSLEPVGTSGTAKKRPRRHDRDREEDIDQVDQLPV